MLDLWMVHSGFIDIMETKRRAEIVFHRHGILDPFIDVKSSIHRLARMLEARLGLSTSNLATPLSS